MTWFSALSGPIARPLGSCAGWLRVRAEGLMLEERSQAVSVATIFLHMFRRDTSTPYLAHNILDAHVTFRGS